MGSLIMERCRLSILNLSTSKLPPMLLIIDTYGARVSVQNKCFAIVKEEESRIISPHRVLAIWISKTARVSTRVFQLAAEFSIPVLILGKQLIWIQNNSNQNNALLLRQQVYFSHSIEAFYFIQQNILNKIKEQLKSGEELYFFDVIAKDTLGRVMYASSLKILIQ